MATTRFVATAIDAMQCKLSALQMASFLAKQERELQGRDNWRGYGHAIQMSELYQWSNHTAEQVLEASRSYPLQDAASYMDWSHESTGLRLARAFLTFDAPVIPWLTATTDPTGLWPRLPDDTDYLPAMFIVPVEIEHTHEREYRFVGLDWDGIRCLPAFELPWPCPADRTPQEIAQCDALMRFLLAASMFVEQRICVASQAPLRRAERKLAARAQVSPLVTTIQLRARETTTTTGAHSQVEYSHRWIVRGHWRNQFYAKAARHMPLWIEPYIKGPEGQPLKPPSSHVFVVKR